MLNKNTKKSKKGFTLTEVLVVVLIIGVISAIAYPVYTKSINKSRAVEAINLLEMVRNKQIANFARRGEYLPTFKDMGQLTSNAEAEIKTEGDAILTVNGKYELAMNNATNCMSAAYIPAKGKPATFTFSSSYEDAGLGCDGDVCKTFGNIVGTSQSVCNCGTKTCSSPYNLNSKTCNCDCPLACREGGCHDKNPARAETRACGNGGTQSRTCPESCGECSASWSSCTGQKCDGNSSEPCDAGYSGTKTRTCNNGTWSGWNISGCTKDPIECEGEATTNCENCGTKSRTCDKTTGTWRAWSACTGIGLGQLPCDTGYWGEKVRECRDNVWGEWDTSKCVPAKTPCGECSSLKMRDYNVEYEEDGECCICSGSNVISLCTRTGGWQDKDTCACVCPANASFVSGNFTGSADSMGGCKCNDGYEGIPAYGEECVAVEKECEGEATANCENCGTKTRTCDKTTGTWSEWSGCVGTKDETAACDSGYTGDRSRTCRNDIWGPWNTDMCKPDIKWSIRSESFDTIVSCSGYGAGSIAVCNGKVSASGGIYTHHQLTRCDLRAKGHSSRYSEYYGKGDGSSCADTNWIQIYDPNGEFDNAYSFSCSGWSSSYRECTRDDYDRCRNGNMYNGQVMCIETSYRNTCVQAHTIAPCLVNGLYCETFSGETRSTKFHPTKGSARVAVCVQE